MQRVGVIGLGRIGSRLADNMLERGIDVVGYDVVAKPEFRGRMADSPASVARAADIIFHSLPDIDALNKVLWGADGLGAACGRQHVIADLSAYRLADKQAASLELGRRGATFLDCQISGTPEMLEKREGVIFASGDQPAIESCRPYFAAATDGFVFVSPNFGDATRVKTINNLLVAMNTLATAEAVGLAGALGIDLGKLIEIVGVGAAQSQMFKQRAPLMASRDFGGKSGALGGFGVYLDLIEEQIHEAGMPLPIASRVVGAFREAIAHGWGDRDIACVVDLYLSPNDRMANDNRQGRNA